MGVLKAVALSASVAVSFAAYADGASTAGFVSAPLGSLRHQSYPSSKRLSSPSQSVAATTMCSSSPDSSVNRRNAMAGIASGVAGLALTSPASTMAAQPNLDPRNAAGVGLNSNNIGQSLRDIKGETPVEEPPAKDPAKMGKKPKTGSKAAGLAIFQDDNLGYAFAMPPSWKGQSNALDSGGQLLAFVDDNNQGKTDALVTILAQPTKLSTIDELEKAIVPKGEVLSKKIAIKDSSQTDGSVIIFEANDKAKNLRVMALFSLRTLPSGNWLVSMTCQASEELYPSYITEFKEIIKGYRPTYASTAQKKKRGGKKPSTEISDDELGVPYEGRGAPKLDESIRNMPFGGK